MASLTETAYMTRKVINWTILVVIAYFVLRLMMGLLITIFFIIFPPKPPPPNHAFGKLPPITFPTPEVQPDTQLQFSLETITGSFPKASDSARVYFMPKQAANLLAINNTQEFAKKLQFDPTPIQETRTVFRFNDLESPIRKLRYDIISNNFIMRYAYDQDTGIFTEGTLRDKDLVTSEANNFLINNQIFSPDLENGTSTVTYLQLVGNSLVPVENISQANAMRVDFFRHSVNTFKLMTPKPTEGQVSILFSPSQIAKKHIIEVIYTLWPIDYQTFGTYSLKPIPDAWQELQNGKGYIAAYPKNGSTTATVRNIYIAYYDNFDPQTYLQPIYVFEGDYGFIGYVPAVANEWIE